MNAKRFSRFPLALCLAAGLSSCVISGVGDGSWRRSAKAHDHHHDSESDRDGLGESSDGDEDGEDATDSAARAKFELQLEELEHARSLIQIQAEWLAAEFELETSIAGLEAAELALEHFAAERKLRIEDAQLDLDRSLGSAEDAELELAELQAMYAEEDFAEKTKELVLNRGRRNLEHAKRRLLIAREELRQLSEVELATRERELQLELKSARNEADAAKHSLEAARLSMKIDTLQAEHDLAEARREVEAGS